MQDNLTYSNTHTKQCLQGSKGKFSAFNPVATHTADMGLHPIYKPPTTNHCEYVHAGQCVVGIRVTDYSEAWVPITLPNR